MTMYESIRPSCLALGAAGLLALGACAKSSSQHTPPPPAAAQGAEATPEPHVLADVPPQARSTTPTQSMHDAQIVRVADVLDTGEIEQSRLAVARARDPRVQAFAQRMVLQHSESRQRSEVWQRGNAVSPEESTASAQLQSNLTHALHALEAMDASMFDATYVHSQVQQHQQALDMLHRQLIPNAIDPELRTQLEQRRDLITTHLAAAQQLQTSLDN